MIFSPMATGNGAYHIHALLSLSLPDYSISGHNRWLTLFPPSLKLLRKRNARIVHTTPDYGCWLWYPEQYKVATCHNYVLDPFMRNFSSPLQNLHYGTDLRYFTRQSLLQADVITAVSHTIAKRVQQDMDIHKPIRVIHNGVDVQLFSPAELKPAPDRKLRILFSGNPTRRKGIGYLPEIATQLGDAAEIWITGGLRGQWAGQLSRLQNIKWLGRIAHKDMPQLYKQVDVLLMPTVREGHSVAILEAMASSLPVVASDIPEIREQITNQAGGILVEVGSVTQFTEALMVLSDPMLRYRYGEFNREVAHAQFTLQSMLNNYCILFEEIYDIIH